MNCKILQITKLSVCFYRTFSLTVLLLLDKTKFVELESAYQELQEKYRLAEQIKSEYDLFKENVNTTDVELKQQLAEEREKTNELQNIINQGITGLF